MNDSKKPATGGNTQGSKASLYKLSRPKDAPKPREYTGYGHSQSDRILQQFRDFDRGSQ